MSTTGFIAVIPARYASSRLPGKPLKDIAGKPMIEWVYRQTLGSGATEVIVATDDERIATACRAFGAPVELTSAEHPSGTDRIAELARRFEWADDQIVVNVQGDEPLISPVSIAQTARLLAWHPDATIATLAAPLDRDADFEDPNFVKVVTTRAGWALYFSRAPIPWPRDGGMPEARRHIGLYAYRAGGLEGDQRVAAVRDRGGREARATARALARLPDHRRGRGRAAVATRRHRGRPRAHSTHARRLAGGRRSMKGMLAKVRKAAARAFGKADPSRSRRGECCSSAWAISADRRQRRACFGSCSPSARRSSTCRSTRPARTRITSAIRRTCAPSARPRCAEST